MNIFGGNIDNYRLSVFVDNQLVPAFNGECYADVNIKKDYMTSLELELDNSILKNGEHTSLFVMTCPIDYNGFNADFMIEKTESSVLIKK